MKLKHLISAVLVSCFASAAVAADYPDRAVKLIVGYPAGGSTDIVARLFAEQLAQKIKQPVVVENKPGAGTNIAVNHASKADPDGYTLLFSGGTPAINSVFGPVPTYEPIKGFEPISMIARVPFMVAGDPNSSVSTFSELMAKAKNDPNSASISSAQLHLYVELLKAKAQSEILHVPYKGGAAASTAAIGGQVDSVLSLIPVLLPQVQSGNLKALGVTAENDVTRALKIPTFKENGVDYDIVVWWGLLAPAGTPKDIVDLLAKATKEITEEKPFKAAIEKIGGETASMTPAELRAYMVEEQQRWKDLAEEIPALKTATAKR